MLLIDEHLDEQGALVQTFLDTVRPAGAPGATPGAAIDRANAASGVTAAAVHAVSIEAGDLRGRLPVAAVETVMRRYGRPLAEDVVPDGPTLDLGNGRALQHLRYLSPVDAAARDYLVWHAPGEEPLAALSNGIAAALRHLATAMQTRGGG